MKPVMNVTYTFMKLFRNYDFNADSVGNAPPPTTLRFIMTVRIMHIVHSSSIPIAIPKFAKTLDKFSPSGKIWQCCINAIKVVAGFENRKTNN